MATEITTWEIVDGTLHPLETTLSESGRTERLDLEMWLETEPTIIGPGLQVIGRQVVTRSGTLDLLAVDRNGDLVVIGVKQDKLARETLTQAIDQASDVATWSLGRIGKICVECTGQGLEDVFSEAFPDVDPDSLRFNGSQRIVLVGFSVQSSLERMVEWLSGASGLGINAVVLQYARTSAGNEVLTRTAIVPEEIEEVRAKGDTFVLPMSDEPGTYKDDELINRLRGYLMDGPVTAQRIRDVVLPACLWRDAVTRDELKEEFIQRGAVRAATKVGYVLSLVSSQIGMENNDFLRQVIGYEYPNYPWEKDNYCIRQDYRLLVQTLLNEIKVQEAGAPESRWSEPLQH